jgi:hypothetical protein
MQSEVFQNRQIVIVSIVASIWLTFIYFPGVLHIDSYVRWNLVDRILHGGGGNRHAIVPALWMMVPQILTQNIASFTLLQSFLFFYTTFYMIKLMGQFTTVWIYLPIGAVLLCPLFQGYSIFQDNAIGTVIALNFMIFMLSEPDQKRSSVNELFCYLLYFLVFISVFGFRQNNITMLPFVAFLLYKNFYLKRNNTRIQIIALITALVALLCLTSILTQYRNIKKKPEISMGLTWDMAKTIKRINDPKYDHYLDYLGDSPQATKNAIKNADGMIWDNLCQTGALSYKKIFSERKLKQIVHDFIQLVLSHPKEFFLQKFDSGLQTLGVFKPLDFAEFYENRHDGMKKFPYRYTEMRNQQIQAVNMFMQKYNFLCYPFFIFILGGVFVFIAHRLFMNQIRYTGTVFLLAVFYYSAFFLITERYEFRYFFPAFYFLALIVLVTATKCFEMAYSQRAKGHNG